MSDSTKAKYDHRNPTKITLIEKYSLTFEFSSKDKDEVRKYDNNNPAVSHDKLFREHLSRFLQYRHSAV